MRFAFLDQGNDPAIVASVQPDGSFLDISRALNASDALRGRDLEPAPSSPLDAAIDSGLPARLSSAVESLQRSGRLAEFLIPAGAALLAPIPNPVRILAIGRNYAEHAKEQGAIVTEEPIVFLKASTTVIGPEKPIEIPDWLGRVDFEVELLVVLGKGGKNISAQDAMSLVAGYTVFNDVTAREQQAADNAKKHPWFRSKSVDTFGPMGPYLVTADEIPDPHVIALNLKVNGEVKQSDITSSMVFKIPALIEFLSKWFELHPGDVIATGTPSGIGPIVPGDIVEATVEGIGTLRNPVVRIV